MAFPTSIPSYAGFTSTHTLSQDNHAAQSNQEQTDITALATKMGTGASTPVNATVLRGNGTGTSAWGQVNLGTDVTNISAFLSNVYPVGCIYTEITGVNPSTTFGFGSWVAFGAGRVLVGNGTSDQSFTAGTSGGESNHTLSSNEMPSHTHSITDPGHTHTYSWGTGTATGSGTTFMLPAGFNNNQATSSNTTGVTANNTGGGASHNNLQPYIVVYFWQRTA